MTSTSIMFLLHKITIYRAITNIVGWMPVDTFSVLHTDIPAMIYKQSKGLDDSVLGRNTDFRYYEVITEDLDIRVWDKATIYLSTNISEENFIVDNLDVNYSLINNWVDNIYFTIKKSNG